MHVPPWTTYERNNSLSEMRTAARFDELRMRSVPFAVLTFAVKSSPTWFPASVPDVKQVEPEIARVPVTNGNPVESAADSVIVRETVSEGPVADVKLPLHVPSKDAIRLPVMLTLAAGGRQNGFTTTNP